MINISLRKPHMKYLTWLTLFIKEIAGPKANISRNSIINSINQYLMNLCNQIDDVNYINTEFKTNIFSTHDGI